MPYINVFIDPELHIALKSLAKDTGTPMYQIVPTMLTESVVGWQERAVVRVSTESSERDVGNESTTRAERAIVDERTVSDERADTVASTEALERAAVAGAHRRGRASREYREHRGE